MKGAATRLGLALVIALLAFLYSRFIAPPAAGSGRAGEAASQRRAGGGEFFPSASVVDALLEDTEGMLASRLWGTYRSGQYLGIRTMLPMSPLVGLMWMGDDRKLRHDADARDGLTKYGWVRHDGQSYGRQQLIDGRTEVRTHFLP